MKTQTLILVIVGAVVVIWILWSMFANQKKEQHTTERPSSDKLPKQEVQNDKLVISNNITFEEIDKILKGFCNMYNQKDSYDALPRLYKINERQFAITFPYDIEFTIFCYFVNYVRYPMGLMYFRFGNGIQA